MPESPENKRIGKRIRRLRKEAGLTQDGLAAKAGIASNTVARAERGEHETASGTIKKIAKALGIKSGDITD